MREKHIKTYLKSVVRFILPTSKNPLYNLIHIFVYITILGVPLLFLFYNVQATDVSGSISSNTTWTLANSPYNMTNNVNITNGAVLTIDAGVEVKSNGNYYLIVDNGTLDVNGSSGNEVTFTHNSQTSYGSWQGIQVNTDGIATIDFAEIYYSTIGVRVSGGSLTINDSFLDTNRVGVSVYEQGSLTTARNTFNSHEYCPLNLNPDVSTINLGSGADADIMGAGADLNGYNAICVSMYDDTAGDCPANLCKLSSRTFAGVSNIPYVFYNNYNISGGDDELEVDASVILKFMSSKNLYIRNGAFIDINGSNGSEVIFTSYKDDSKGGDTNNDGATTGSVGDWGNVLIEGGTNTIDYAEVYYADNGIRVYNTSTTATVNDSTFDYNRVGINVYGKGSLTTARNTFTNNSYFPVNINPDVSTVTFGSGGDADTLGAGNGYDAIGLSYSVQSTNDCPSNLCKLSSRTFAGTSNIPYMVYNDYRVQGGGDELEVDAGVITKFVGGKSLYISNGSFVDINGSNGSEVIFTSYKDDSQGGDTNNDGATTGAVGDWGNIMIEGGTNTIDYAEIYYADNGIRVYNTSTDTTINDSTFDHNRVGINVYERGSLTTARNTFTNNSYFPVNINPDASTVTFGSGGDADTLGAGNGYDALGVSYGDQSTNDCPSNLCKLSSRTFAGTSNIPYMVFYDYRIQGSGDELEVDAGVITKFVGGRSLYVSNGSFVDINGSNGSEAIFTSYRDDTKGGDTNNDGATTGAIGDWGNIIIEGGTNTIDYAEIYYADNGIRVYNTTVAAIATVNDSTFDYNRVGINVYERGSLTTARNTFTNSYYFPVNINPDVSTVTFGSGGDADTLGAGNGYDAIGIAYSDNVADNCPSDLCRISSRTFSGTSNIPYVLQNDYYIQGSGDEIEIDQSVIIKFLSGKKLTVKSGAFLDINGVTGSPIFMTSDKNDSIGDDTNNDSDATSPSSGDWSGLWLENTGAHTIDFLYMDYANNGLYVNSATNVTVSDSYFRNNNYGIYNNNLSGSPTFSQINMKSNATYGMYTTNATVISAESLWWGASNGPYDASDGGQCSSNDGDGDIVRDENSYPIDYCPYSSSKFNSAAVTTNATSDITDSTATGNANLTSLDGFFDIDQHGHIWNEDSNVRYLNLITQYKMNDNAANTTVVDNMNSYNGTSVQNTQDITDTGKINSCLTFNGTSDDISISNIPTPELPFTMTFWVYPTSSTPIGMFDTAPGQGNVLRNYTAGNFEWHSGSPSFALGLSANVWQHLAFVFDHDGTNRIVDYYRNGSLISSNSSVGNDTFTWTGGNIGSINNGGGGWFEGKIDDFRIYQNELTSTEISSIYNSGNGTEDRIYNFTQHGSLDATGTYTSSLTSLSASTNYYTRSYIELSDGIYVEGSIDSFTTSAPGSPPTAQASDITGESDIYAGETKDTSAIYTDPDGASNLDEMYIMIQNPGGTDIEYYADEGVNGSGLTPTHVSGSAYVTAITYDRSVSGNNITVTWHITFDWDWVENTNIEYGVKAIDDDTNDSGWDYTDSDFNYENDLTYYGTISVTGSVNGSLSSGDWVQDSEIINWTGIKVVYEGTNDKYPPDSDFDARVIDDDSDTWTDTTSSGTNIDIDSTADNALDTENIHNIDIINIPSGGSDLSTQSFTIRIDDTIPDIVDVTGDNEGVWQNSDSGPTISWTDPASPSDDVFYITNDGTTPTNANHEYTTTNVTYDLPQQGEGETSIMVRPMNGADKYGDTKTFLIKYDSTAPVNVANLTANALSVSSIKLEWDNPGDSDFDHVAIRRKTISVPSSPSDGDGVYSGSLETYTDTGLDSSTKYYYSVFAYDSLGNVSSGAATSATTLAITQEDDDSEDTTDTPSEVEDTEDEIEEQSLIEELEELEEESEEIKVEEEEPNIIFSIDGKEIDIKDETTIHAYNGSVIEAKIPIEIIMEGKENTEIDDVMIVIGDSVYIMVLDENGEFYTATFTSPELKGDYDVFVIVKYMDETTQKINMNLSVDPYGYVYTILDGNELRIKDAKVSLYRYSSSEEILWVSEDDKYKNPQYTNQQGEYTYLVDPGEYRLEVEKEGYKKYVGERFSVEGNIIEKNIQLEVYKKGIDIKIIIITVLIIISLITISVIYVRKINA